MSVIVYTTIFGGSDSLKPAPAGADLCVCFTDDMVQDRKGWTLVPPPIVADDPRRAAWYVRCVPHTFLDDYDRVVWIDASFTLTNLPRLLRDAGDAPIAALRHHRRSNCYEEAHEIASIGQAPRVVVDRQMAVYRKAGFNASYLSISCVIVRDRSESVRSFNETWADEIRRWPGDNTQLSLDYAAWKAGLKIVALSGSRHANPYAIHDHDDHKKRRQPYRSAA